MCIATIFNHFAIVKSIPNCANIVQEYDSEGAKNIDSLVSPAIDGTLQFFEISTLCSFPTKAYQRVKQNYNLSLSSFIKRYETFDAIRFSQSRNIIIVTFEFAKLSKDIYNIIHRKLLLPDTIALFVITDSNEYSKHSKSANADIIPFLANKYPSKILYIWVLRHFSVNMSPNNRPAPSDRRDIFETRRKSKRNKEKIAALVWSFTSTIPESGISGCEVLLWHHKSKSLCNNLINIFAIVEARRNLTMEILTHFSMHPNQNFDHNTLKKEFILGWGFYLDYSSLLPHIIYITDFIREEPNSKLAFLTTDEDISLNRAKLEYMYKSQLPSKDTKCQLVPDGFKQRFTHWEVFTQDRVETQSILENLRENGLYTRWKIWDNWFTWLKSYAKIATIYRDSSARDFIKTNNQINMERFKGMLAVGIFVVAFSMIIFTAEILFRP